jgi:3-oxoadipate enol-lactonase
MLLDPASTGHDADIDWFTVGSGAPVVLIHGIGDDHRAWRRVVGHLMLTRQVVLYDLRGQGGSGLGRADGTLTQLSNDLIVLLDALDIPQATLAGFSLGGTIAMQTAITAPDRVNALALIATSSRVNTAAASWYAHRAGLVDAADPELHATLDHDTEDVYRSRPSEIADGLRIRREASADPRGYANACRAMAAMHSAPLDAGLSAITAPTVILAGDVDQHCPPRAGEIIASRISGSRLLVLAETGHPLPVERPVEVAEAILSVPGV